MSYCNIIPDKNIKKVENFNNNSYSSSNNNNNSNNNSTQMIPIHFLQEKLIEVTLKANIMYKYNNNFVMYLLK